MVAGPSTIALDASGSIDVTSRLIVELIQNHTGVAVPPFRRAEAKAASCDDQPLLDEQTCLATDFDNNDENVDSVNQLAASSSKAVHHTAGKKGLSRRSSAGVYNAFADMKIEWS